MQLFICSFSMKFKKKNIIFKVFLGKKKIWNLYTHSYVKLKRKKNSEFQFLYSNIKRKKEKNNQENFILLCFVPHKLATSSILQFHAGRSHRKMQV